MEGCCCGRSKSEDVVAVFAEEVLLSGWQVDQVKVRSGQAKVKQAAPAAVREQ